MPRPGKEGRGEGRGGRRGRGEEGEERGRGGKGERREGGGEREEEERKVKSKKRNMDARGGGKGRDTANNTDNLNSTELRLASFPCRLVFSDFQTGPGNEAKLKFERCL